MLIVLKSKLMTTTKRTTDRVFGRTYLSLDVSAYVHEGWVGRVNWIESFIFTDKVLLKSC